MKMHSIITHTGEFVQGQRFQDALDKVADDMHKTAHAIFNADKHASHVTKQQKLDQLEKGLRRSEEVRNGEVYGLWLWQSLNTVLTGECIALMA